MVAEGLDMLVSIIMPSYNAARFVGAALDSVLAQTYTNWELLVVDDASKDESVKAIEAYAGQDVRIRLIPLSRNVGAAAARNIALEQARGRYIAFLDSDDVWSPNKLERQIAFMQAHGYAFTITGYDTIDEAGSSVNRVIHVPSKLTYRQYLRNTIIGCLTVVIDRQQTGDFRMPEIKSSHDMALWCLIMRRGFDVYGLDEVLAHYRLVSTSNTAKKWKAAKDVWRVYREWEHLSVPYAAFNFCGYVLHAVIKRL